MSEMLSLIDEQVEVEQKEEWKITDDSVCDWWIERNQEELAEVSRLEMQIKAKLEFYNQKLMAAQEKKEQIITNRDYKLMEYFDSIPDKDKKKTKTLTKYQLPSGTLQIKQQNPKYIKNDKELLEYVKQNESDLVEVKETVKWGEFKKQVSIVDGQVIDSKTGEILPIKIEEQAPVFEVKI